MIISEIKSNNKKNSKLIGSLDENNNK